MTMTTVTITFEIETPLTGIEKQCLETQLIDEYLADNVQISQDNE